jgi:hypothetical protein
MFKRKAKEPKIKKPRFQTFRDAYKVTKQVKPWISVALIGIFAVSWGIGIAIGSAVGETIYFAFVFLPVALLITLFFFTRQAGTAAYAPAVAVARNQDMVHRSVGRAGIVLTGEGTNAVRQMIADERKKAERFAPGVPITEILVGNEDGRVPIRKIQKQMRRLPKKLTAHQMREVRARLKAVGGMSMPIPKGPMPTRAPKIR